jgi:hypothetical protein
LNIYHCAQQGRAYATHAAVLEQLRDMLKAARCVCRWAVKRTIANPTAPGEMREWRAGLSGYGFHGNSVLVDATIRNFYAPSYLASRSVKALFWT